MTLPKKVDVVVVGAGPTGLTLACTLRVAGHDVLVLDKATEGQTRRAPRSFTPEPSRCSTNCT